MQREITILYPLCPSHSGSTLLSILMGSQKYIYGVGELFVFSDRPSHLIQKKEEKCSCNGQTKEDCPFWQQVEQYLQTHHQITLDELNVESKDPIELKRHNQYLFQAIAAIANCSIIVDASKVVSRFVQLRAAGFTVIPLHFRRNPCALVYSWMKRGHDWRQVAQYYPDFYQEVAKHIPDRKPLAVTYEAFIENPTAFLQRLLRHLNLPLDAIELDWTKKDHHTLKGNAVRFQKDKQLKASTTWKSKLTIRQKAHIYLKAFPCIIDTYWFYYSWARFIRLFIWTKYP